MKSSGEGLSPHGEDPLGALRGVDLSERIPRQGREDTFAKSPSPLIDVVKYFKRVTVGKQSDKVLGCNL